MNRLAGYALPGALMVLFGAKWSWSAAGEAGGQRKRPCAPSCPLEGLVKVCAGGAGVVTTLAAAAVASHTNPDVTADADEGGGRDATASALSTATIYLFFALSGLADVASAAASTPPPRRAARLAFPLAFAAEGALVLLALPPEPSPLRRPLQIIAAAAWGCAASVTAHAARPALAPARAAAALAHGTWLVHAGLVASGRGAPYRRLVSEDGSTIDVDAWAAVAFAWHVAAAVAALVVLSSVRRWCSSTPPAPPEFDAGPPRPPHGPCPFCDGLGGHHQGPC
ncbi:transmembrane protein 45B-like [Hetaerina americana]|uniref:transmembrane protein 45B-like n=1 Tax=Hetaerina americana TaxID=62018 RepID=UPI003A7F48EF